MPLRASEDLPKARRRAMLHLLGLQCWSPPVRLSILSTCLLLAVPTNAAPYQQLDTLTPTQAITRAAAASPKPVRALFQFKVQSAAKTREGFYLDSEKDFHASSNLGVAIKASAMPGLTQKYGQDLKSAFVG